MASMISLSNSSDVSSFHEYGRWKIGMRKTLEPDSRSPTVVVLVLNESGNVCPRRYAPV
jgi:hypothetical protein